MHLDRFQWAVAALVVSTFISFTAVGIMPLDDHFHYQRFIETLATGQLDLTIPGFHGSDFLAVPYYWLTASSHAQIHLQIFCAVLLPLLAYLAGRNLFASRSEALILAAIITSMPFIGFVGLRGWTGSAYFALMLGAIASIRHYPQLSAVLWALAILTKPFAVVLLPILWLLQKETPRQRALWLVTPCVLVGAYLLTQYLQAGEIIVGAHQGLNQVNVWQGPVRWFLNAAHSVQILFSVHNYYFPDPGQTGPGNLMHTSPLLVMLGLFALFTRDFWSLRWRQALFGGFIVGIGLNMLLDHMDHFYMQAGILCLIIAAIPLLKRMPIWIPLVLATLHFQWFYFYLQFWKGFTLQPHFFTAAVVVDLLFLLTCIIAWRQIYATVRTLFVAESDT